MKQLARKKQMLTIGFAVAAIIFIYGCGGKSSEKDKTKPIITLNGATELVVPMGEVYSDLGVAVTDNLDKEIMDKLKVTIMKDGVEVKTLETKDEGVFEIKYNVSDSAGNPASEVVRKVTIENKNLLFIKTNKTSLYDNIGKDSKKVATLFKGSEIEKISEKTDDKKETWIQIKYGEKKEIAWVNKKDITETRAGLINEKYKSLDYSSYPKTEFPNNPKVKVKGVYVNIYTASGKKLDSFIEMTKRTEINAFVIDVKDDNGHLLFKMDAGDKYAPKANDYQPIKDIKAFMKKLKDNNIYTIARIVSFKDPIYTEAHPDRAIVYKKTGKPFTNSDNLKWATAYDRELWNYDIAVAKEAALAGFNEIQFDYVRFPASNGGKLDSSLDYRNEKNEIKAKAIQEFLISARKTLNPMEVYTSADVFGQVTSIDDDMGLGQYWEGISNVVDYISPMIYPSHYGNNVYGLAVPDAFPYETVFQGTKDGLNRNKNISTPAGMRPWIQDFTAAWVKGHIKYGDKEVAQQIKALKDNGVEEYLLWNASNRYSEGAVKK